jgi:hypothetical protein
MFEGSPLQRVHLLAVLGRFGFDNGNGLSGRLPKYRHGSESATFVIVKLIRNTI